MVEDPTSKREKNIDALKLSHLIYNIKTKSMPITIVFVKTIRRNKIVDTKRDAVAKEIFHSIWTP